MTAFADASAVVKRYADEDDAAIVRAQDLLVISALTLVEVPAALWRKHRLGELTADDARVLTDAFAADVATGRLIVAAITDAVISDAARLVAVHALRASDAVQLATARTVRVADPACTTFACFDAQLARAAAGEGFAALTA